MCADDAHGTAVMFAAQKQAVDINEYIDIIRKEHEQDIRSYNISLDNFYTTHSSENQQLVKLIFSRLQQSGLIFEKTVEQLFDEQEQIFLADRYVKGTCPKCQAKDQYGDNCEVCGASYSARDLKDAYSVLSSSKPVLKTSKHYFLDVNQEKAFLQEWVASGVVNKEIANKLLEWFGAPLHPWDISRDAPYFGIPIPGEESKYFYVWLDAPIGYLASFENYLQQHSSSSALAWLAQEGAEMYHFIGKDIAYFHTLFWGTMLKNSQLPLPKRVFVHGFLTIEGEKMSKSRGTFITASKLREAMQPDPLRYYFASRLSSRAEEINFEVQELVNLYNSDIVGKFVNLLSRSAKILANYADLQVLPESSLEPLLDYTQLSNSLAEHYESAHYSKLVKDVMAATGSCNAYIDRIKPWEYKDKADKLPAIQACSYAIHAVAKLAVFLKPICPDLCVAVFSYLGKNLEWQDVICMQPGFSLQEYTPLARRLDAKKLRQQLLASEPKNEPAKNSSVTIQGKLEDNLVNIDEFKKMQIVVVEVVSALRVDGSNKLLELVVKDDSRNYRVFSGIAEFYPPETLVGKKLLFLRNLQPRKMRFGTSEGMLLALENESGSRVNVVEVGSGCQVGDILC